MLEREQFKKFIKLIQKLDKRDLKLTKALQEYTGDTDFTGFRDSIQDRLLDWLVETMHDTSDSTILWWLYDCPAMGRTPEHCTIIWTNEETGRTEKRIILTLDDLYDYLTLRKKT